MSHQVGLAVFYVDTRLDHPQEKWIEIILVDGKLVDFMEFSPAKIVDFMGFTGIFPCEHIFLQGFYRDKQWNHCIYIYHQQQYGLTWVDDVERHIWIHGSVFLVWLNTEDE